MTDNKSTQPKLQLTELQKADLVSFADGLWVSCGIILNYIGSQWLVVKRCSELWWAWTILQENRLESWNSSSEESNTGACQGLQHLKDCRSLWDALWGWPSNPRMGCGAFCPKGRSPEQLSWLFCFWLLLSDPVILQCFFVCLFVCNSLKIRMRVYFLTPVRLHFSWVNVGENTAVC